jgi:hypothetical protein
MSLPSQRIFLSGIPYLGAEPFSCTEVGPYLLGFGASDDDQVVNTYLAQVLYDILEQWLAQELEHRLGVSGTQREGPLSRSPG